MVLPNGATPSGSCRPAPFRVGTSGTNTVLRDGVTEVYGEILTLNSSDYQKRGIPPVSPFSPPDFMNDCHNLTFEGGRFITAGRKIVINSDPEPISVPAWSPVTPQAQDTVPSSYWSRVTPQAQDAVPSSYLRTLPSTAPPQVRPSRTSGLNEYKPPAPTPQKVPDLQPECNDTTHKASPATSAEPEIVWLPERGSRPPSTFFRSWQHRQGTYQLVDPNSKGLAMWKAVEDKKAYGFDPFLPRK